MGGSGGFSPPDLFDLIEGGGGERNTLPRLVRVASRHERNNDSRGMEWTKTA